jgi:predicted phage terminase large subunit-like protein
MTTGNRKTINLTRHEATNETIADVVFKVQRGAYLSHIRAGVDQQHPPPQPLLEWGRQYLPHYFSKPASAMHVWLATQLDRSAQLRGLKINLIGPRGSAKSTVGTLCAVLRAAVEGREPYIWIVSDTIEQALLHMDNVKRELTDNPALIIDFPHSVGRGRRWQRHVIELANRVVVEAWSTGQRIRGRRRREHRPTLIVCDDLQNDSHISSAAQRESSRSWFHGTLLKAGTKETNVVNLATALHREALAMELLTAPGWTSKRFASIESWPDDLELWNQWEAIYTQSKKPPAEPGADGLVPVAELLGGFVPQPPALPGVSDAASAARAFFDANKEAMLAGAVVLWPEVEDLYTLMRMRVESGRTAFEREKQGSPIDSLLCEFPEEYFDGDTFWFDEWPRELAIRAVALDPSKGKDAQRGDYSAFVMLGIDATGVIYVDADLARRPTPEIVADAAAICRRFQPTVFGVEANQFQELLADEIAAEFSRQQIAFVAPAAIHNYVNKQVRIRKIGPYLSQRRLRFLAGSESARMLVDQLRDFPLGAHDDGPDALEMALRLAEDVWSGKNADDGLGDRLIHEP